MISDVPNIAESELALMAAFAHASLRDESLADAMRVELSGAGGIVTTMRMMPVPDSVGIPFIFKQIEDGEFVSQPAQDSMLPFHLDEVLRWSKALKPLRAQVPELRTLRPPGAPPLPPC